MRPPPDKPKQILKHSNSNQSLHYELENSLSSISPNNFLDSGSFLASIAKVATTRQNSTQTDPPATFTLSTQYDRDEHTLSAGTNTRPVVVTSSAAQADAVHFRDTFAQSSPVDVMSVSIGAGCGIAGLVDAGVECAPWEFSASGEGVAVQTMDYGSDSGVDVGVQAGRVLLHDAVAVQTERAVCRDSGVVGEVDVAPVAVVPVAVQTLWEAEARGTQTLRVKAVASSVQTEVGPGDAVSVQTERLGVDGFVQTERAAVIENGVQTEVVLAHHGGFQTDTVLLLDWGMQTDDVKVMERGMETEFVMRAEGTMQTEFLGVDTVVQTEFHSISFASQTDVVCGIASSTQTQFSGAHRSAQTDAVSVTTREVQVGQRVDSLPRGVQTDRADCVSAAFGLLTYGRGVQTDLDGDDVSNLEVDVERLRARCDDLEREVLAFDGEREMVVVFEAELRMLEKTCVSCCVIDDA
ncbi:hypothetical protein BC830DRAFT_636552 [Chytriomyces sp. MP71]|nr:hypothetical protein BC830DRAFT_636552 [Chytriomyces sp. MP71]